MRATFNYTKALKQVVVDIVRHLPALSHIKTSKILVSFSKARKRTQYGTYAKLVPLRLKGGKFSHKEGRKVVRTPKWVYRGKEYLYILYVYMPRFHDQTVDGKIMTLIHELYHISPACDGDLRTFGTGRYHHGGSEKEFEAQLEPLTREYLSQREQASCLDFLKVPTERIEQELGRLTGLHVQVPTVTVTYDD